MDDCEILMDCGRELKKQKKKCVSVTVLLLQAFIAQSEERNVPLQMQCYGAGFLGPQTGQRTSRLFRCCNQQEWGKKNHLKTLIANLLWSSDSNKTTAETKQQQIDKKTNGYRKQEDCAMFSSLLFKWVLWQRKEDASQLSDAVHFQLLLFRFDLKRYSFEQQAQSECFVFEHSKTLWSEAISFFYGAVRHEVDGHRLTHADWPVLPDEEEIPVTSPYREHAGGRALEGLLDPTPPVVLLRAHAHLGDAESTGTRSAVKTLLRCLSLFVLLCVVTNEFYANCQMMSGDLLQQVDLPVIFVLLLWALGVLELMPMFAYFVQHEISPLPWSLRE